MTDGISRRQFLIVSSTGAAAVTFGWGLHRLAGDEVSGFFSDDERAALEAAAERVLPGARDAGAVEYIERLLTAFDGDPPAIFAGGPYSGRFPYPDHGAGAASASVPRNSFRRFLPLSRVREIAWRVRLYGSASVPGGDFNDAALEPRRGWRDVYREGVLALDATSLQRFGTGFAALAGERQDEMLAEADSAFVGALIEHTLEGTYADPEYGGNLDLGGWRSSAFDGDSQPLGYSVFDRPANRYRERAGAPVSTPNPDEGYAGLEGAPLELLTGIVTGLGGRRFF